MKLPEPLVEDIIEDRCLPIVGAGFSQNAVLPSGKSMPNWLDLGKLFADQMVGVAADDPIEAISAYCHKFKRTKLIEQVRRALHVGEAKPGAVHRAFCELPFDLVCTTNFDQLLEQGYDLADRPYNTLVEDEQLSMASDRRATKILKLHGDIQHPRRMVLTEDDYDSFAVKRPLMVTYLASLLITRTPLFIGYSLSDPDLRQIWQLVKQRLGDHTRPGYAFVRDRKPANLKRWERRNVVAITI